MTRDLPFENTRTTSDQLYSFDDFRSAKKLLRDGLERKKRYLLLTGESGSGKTSVLSVVRKELDRCRFRFLYFNIARLSPSGFIRVLARCLRTPLRNSLPETVRELTSVLRDEPGRTVIALDEAQLLPDDTFAAIRTLAEFDLGGKSPLSVLLLGLPTLRDRLQSPRLFSFWRRIHDRSELTGLRREEMALFTEHLLGPDQAERFCEQTQASIFEQARGIPGLLVPYLELVLREVPDGRITTEKAESIIQQWELP